MGKKPKGKDQAPAPNIEKISRGMENLRTQLDRAGNIENLEKIKFTLIKLFDQLKTSPNTDDLNENRIAMIKECNLNLQYINQDEDIWVLFKQHQVQQAYDQSIFALKTMNNHPQRQWIKPWVRETVLQTMQKIAELVTSLPTNQKTPLQGKGKDKTFVAPWEANATPIHAHSPVPPQNTFRPNETQLPFENQSSPFPPLTEEFMAQGSSRGDTFKPMSSPASPPNLVLPQSEAIPPWKPDSLQEQVETVIPPTQDESDNSIQKFWGKRKEKTQKLPPNKESAVTPKKTKKILPQEPN